MRTTDWFKPRSIRILLLQLKLYTGKQFVRCVFTLFRNFQVQLFQIGIGHCHRHRRLVAIGSCRTCKFNACYCRICCCGCGRICCGTCCWACVRICCRTCFCGCRSIPGIGYSIGFSSHSVSVCPAGINHISFGIHFHNPIDPRDFSCAVRILLQIPKGIRPALIIGLYFNPFFVYDIAGIVVNRFPLRIFVLFSLQLQVNTARKLFRIRNLRAICIYPFFGYSDVSGQFVIILKYHDRIFCFCCNGSVYGALLYIKGCFRAIDQNLLQGRVICRSFCNLIICSDGNSCNRIGFSLL